MQLRATLRGYDETDEEYRTRGLHKQPETEMYSVKALVMEGTASYLCTAILSAPAAGSAANA